jgi:hypothetical protein
MKYCPQCKQTKSCSAFYKSTANLRGLAGYCKSCNNANVKAYRHTPMGRKKLQDSKYVLEHWRRCWVLTVLGGQCLQCRTVQDLCIHHTKYDGAARRKACGMGLQGGDPGRRAVYYKNMLETACEGLQLMCNSCHTGHHQKLKQKV